MTSNFISCIIVNEIRREAKITKIYVITGHGGVGKTNFSINLALRLRNEKSERKITVCDLDTVNPYFRMADFMQLCNANRIKLLAPRFANTNLDIPAIDFDMTAEILSSDVFIVDAGGDDAGAAVLRTYHEPLTDKDTEILYLVNFCCRLTSDANSALEIMREIEASSGLRHTAYVNNTNMGTATTVKTILDGLKTSEEFAKVSELPLFANTFDDKINADIPDKFPCKIFVGPVWNK